MCAKLPVRVMSASTQMTVPSIPQKLLGVSQAEIRQKCQERVKELEELKTAVDSLKVTATVHHFWGPAFYDARSLVVCRTRPSEPWWRARRCSRT